MYQEFKMENIRYLYLGTCPWEAASVNHPLYISFGITEQTKSGQKL